MTLPQKANPVRFILTADRIRAKPFYAGVLGLKVIAEDGFDTTFDLGGGKTMTLTDLPGHTALGDAPYGASLESSGQPLSGAGIARQGRHFHGLGRIRAGCRRHLGCARWRRTGCVVSGS